MDELALKAVIRANISAAAGHLGGELSDERSEAMDYYLGEPFGNEKEGRSSVVSTDVADRIEWLMPYLMETFTGTEDAIVFDPVGAEDEAAAEQETDYVNHVFFKDNPGWLNLYTFVKDALLQKTGVFKIFWEETEKVSRETYENLSEDEFLYLTNQKNVDVAEHTEETVTAETPEGLVMQTVHHVVLNFKETEGRARVIPVPPEEFGISRDHNSIRIQDADFVYHKTDKTISELLEAGYDKKIIDRIPDGSDVDSEEEIARKHLTDEQAAGEDNLDQSMRKVTVYECYARVDYDGDDVAELRKITYAGEEILDNEEIDQIPFAAATPIILTHKFFGLSVADVVKDLQLIKSSIWRQVLDNAYLNNNKRTGVDITKVNMDDVLTSKPGAPYRVKGNPRDAIMDIPVQDISGIGYQMLDYADRVLDGRVGVSQRTMGLDDSLLANNKGDATVSRVMTAAEQRMELVARVIAETGLKDAYLMLHSILLKNQDKERVVKLRNQWTPVNPREWKERTNMTVSVGLGKGSKNEQVFALSQVMNIQEKIVANGGMGVLVNPMNIYQAATDLAKHTGIKGAERYFTNPSSPEVQQQLQAQQDQPDPQMVLIQAQAAVENQKREIEAAELTVKEQLEREKMQIERENNEMQAALKAAQNEIMALKAQAEAADKMEDRLMRAATDQMKQEIEVFKAELKQ